LIPAARALLREGPAPDADALRAATEAASLRAPEVLAWRADGGDAASQEARLWAWVRSRAPSPETPRCAVLREGVRLVAALVPRASEVTDLAPEGGMHAWRVALPVGATEPAVLIALDDGPVQRVAIDAEGRAAARVPSDATLQVVLSRGGDPQVWARWRVGAGRAAEETSVQQPEEVLRAVNALRARVGFASLRQDPLLALVARGYADELAAARRLAHVIDGVDPAARLAQAGLRADVVAEDIARAPTLDGAWRSLLGSPAHRGNLVEARVDAAGVGVARADGQVYLVVLLASRAGLVGAGAVMSGE
jgi:uncharacterized protein YkwD